MTSQSSQRRGPGRRWKKGQSGNPGGIPAAVLEARRLALEHAPKAIRRLAALLDSKDPRVRLAAAEGLLDRAGVKAIALDEQRGEGGPGTTVVVQLALPAREVPPSFLSRVGPAALQARDATVEAVAGSGDGGAQVGYGEKGAGHRGEAAHQAPDATGGFEP